MVHLLINKGTTDTSGNPIPAGAIIGWNTIFPLGKNAINYPTFCYRSLADYNSGKNVVVLTEITNYSYIKTLSDSEFASLETQAGAITKVAQWMKDYLVSTGQFVDADLTIVIS